MKTGFLITGVAIAALVAGGASATIHKSHHRSHMGAADMYAAPSQPIPYAQLDSYLAAKPSQRASMGDSAGSMGANPAPQASDTSMAAPATAPASGAGDQMGSSNSGGTSGMSSGSGAGMSGSEAMPPNPSDPGMTGKSPPENATPPAATPGQGSPDGSTPPK